MWMDDKAYLSNHLSDGLVCFAIAGLRSYTELDCVAGDGRNAFPVGIDARLDMTEQLDNRAVGLFGGRDEADGRDDDTCRWCRWHSNDQIRWNLEASDRAKKGEKAAHQRGSDFPSDKAGAEARPMAPSYLPMNSAVGLAKWGCTAAKKIKTMTPRVHLYLADNIALKPSPSSPKVECRRRKHEAEDPIT